MEAIFHEKQEGSLCAQHCLNALLQGPYFTAVDLATLAQQMDDEERARMAESGIDTEEYRRFLEQPSGNMDDSGYFSIQVISSALAVWGLELIPFSSSADAALSAQTNPADMEAYICNYRDHWFSVRKIGLQWFNLNSLLSAPELLSDTYLALFLKQLQQEGYSIFLVLGHLPDCEADQVLRLTPAVQTEKPKLISEVKALTAIREDTTESEDDQLQRALQLSLEADRESPLTRESESEDEQLKKALEMSLEYPATSISFKIKPSPSIRSILKRPSLRFSVSSETSRDSMHCSMSSLTIESAEGQSPRSSFASVNKADSRTSKVRFDQAVDFIDKRKRKIYPKEHIPSQLSLQDADDDVLVKSTDLQTSSTSTSSCTNSREEELKRITRSFMWLNVTDTEEDLQKVLEESIEKKKGKHK